MSFGVPSAPLITTITPAIVPTNVHQLTIAFTPPVFGAGLTSYQYSLTGTSGPWLDLSSVDATSPIVVDSGLTANTEYLVSIRAIKVGSPVVLGAPSASVRVRTFGPAGPPRISEIRPTSGTLTVTFCAPQFDGTRTRPAAPAGNDHQLQVLAQRRQRVAVSPAAATSPITREPDKRHGLLGADPGRQRVRRRDPVPGCPATPGTVPGAPNIPAFIDGRGCGLAR